MRQRALAHAEHRVLEEWIVQKKPVILGYGTGRGFGGVHRDAPSLPVNGMCRMMKQACARCGVTLGDGLPDDL